MNPNPPIRGHELLWEGHARQAVDWDTEMYIPGKFLGGCRCGAQPPGWPDVSIGATKRWHREHKAQLRAAP